MGYPASSGIHGHSGRLRPVVTATELRAIRQQLGLSQADMAAKLHISVRAYGRYERGERRITEVLAMAVRWLLSGRA